MTTALDTRAALALLGIVSNGVPVMAKVLDPSS